MARYKTISNPPAPDSDSFYPWLMLDLVEALAVESGAGLSYAGTWTDGTGLAGKFYKTPYNEVRLEGNVGGGTVNTQIATLPVGYRPANTERFLVPYNNGGHSNCLIEIASDGSITQINASGTITWVSLSGIVFRVGN